MALNDSFVTTGFSQPYAARYNYDATEGTVAYSGGLKVGRGVSVSLEVEQNDGDGFYADNILAESDQGQFTAGTANVTIDGLDKEAANLLLNVPQVADSAVAPNDKIYYGAETQVENGYVGFGYIVRQRFHNRTWYRVHILPKVQFGIPGESAETSTDSINYQTQEMAGVISRSDAAVTMTLNNQEVTFQPWLIKCGTKYPTEEQAIARLKSELNIA